MSAPRVEPADSLKKDETLSKLLTFPKEPVSISTIPDKLGQPLTKSGMTSLFMDLLILQRENKVKMEQKIGHKNRFEAVKMFRNEITVQL